MTRPDSLAFLHAEGGAPPAVDLRADTTTLASQADGAAADDNSFTPSISADGRFVAFDSDADNLSTGDDNRFRNVFRQDLVGPPPRCSDVAQAVAHTIASIVILPCSDADGDPITRSLVDGPAHGTLGAIDQSSGAVIYTPDPGYAGPDTFRFQGADASGASNTATANLTVAGPPHEIASFAGKPSVVPGRTPDVPPQTCTAAASRGAWRCARRGKRRRLSSEQRCRVGQVRSRSRRSPRARGRADRAS